MHTVTKDFRFRHMRLIKTNNVGVSLLHVAAETVHDHPSPHVVSSHESGAKAPTPPSMMSPPGDFLRKSKSAPWMVKHSTPWMACPPPTFSSDRILEWRQPPTRAASRPQNCWGSSTDQHGTPTSPLGLVPYQRRSQPFAADAWVERRRALRIEHMATGLASLNVKDARAGSVAHSFGRTSRGEFGFSSSSTLSGNSFDSLVDFTRHGASAPWKAGIPQKPRPATAASSRSRF